MKIGASTSNFYPQQPEEALDALLPAGFRTLELFLNAPSEAEPAYIRSLHRRVEEAGAQVVTVHPYSSFMEPAFLFSLYERRYTDGLEMYKPMFEAAAELGAHWLVIHGDRENGALPVEASVERYAGLCRLGKTFGVLPALENVVKFRSAEIAYLAAVRQALGEDACFVMDLKQARRSGLPWQTVLETMGDRLVHIHVSDGNETESCLLPGKGNTDFAALFRRLREQQYQGALVLELYRRGFSTVEDLQKAAQYLEMQKKLG